MPPCGEQMNNTEEKWMILGTLYLLKLLSTKAHTPVLSHSTVHIVTFKQCDIKMHLHLRITKTADLYWIVRIY